MNPILIPIVVTIVMVGVIIKIVTSKVGPLPEPHKVKTMTATFHLAGGSVDKVFKDRVEEGYEDIWVYSAKEQAREFIHSPSHYFKLDDGSYLNKSQIHKITLKEGEE